MKQDHICELVFQRWSGENGVLLERSSWDHLTSITNALDSSTWEEFRKALPDGEFENLLTWYANGGEYVYRDEDGIHFIEEEELEEFLEWYGEEYVIDEGDPFEMYQVVGVADGDYPPWIDAIESVVLPEVLVEAYGIGVTSWINGSWIEFPIKDLCAIRRLLGMVECQLVAAYDFGGEPLGAQLEEKEADV